MPGTLRSFGIVIAGLTAGWLAFCASAAAQEAISRFRGSYDLGVMTGTVPGPHDFFAVAAIRQPDVLLARIKTALQDMQHQRRQRTLQNAASFGAASRQAGGLDALLAQRLSQLDQRVAAAERQHSPATEIAELRDERTALSRYHPIWLCRGSGPQARASSGSRYFGGLPEPADVVQPGDIVAIAGCHFGHTDGTVTLTLGSSGQKVVLEEEYGGQTSWTDDLVTLEVPEFSGVTDQPATITVQTTSGQVAAPLNVDFVAMRDAQIFDIKDHGNLIGINYACLHAATDDSCGGALPGDKRWPGGRTFADAHYKVCCRSTNSTDIYSLRLLNGWTLPGLDRYADLPYALTNGFSLQDILSGALIFDEGGGTTCWAFGSNHAGHLSGVAYGASSLQGYTVQIAFSWHVDGHCSYVDFDGDILLSGPLNVPYWQ